jgi:DNA mismatch repair protein MutL
VALTGKDGESRAFKLLGQFRGTLILLEGPEGLYLVDQHVAHERILYERLRRQLAEEKPQVQQLLEPALLELAPAEAMRLAELAGRLETCGFDLHEMSGHSIALRGVPAAIGLDEAEALLMSLIREGTIEDDPEKLRQGILDSLAASMACRAAVKMHEPLTPDEMVNLISELFAAEQPYACPHGRPIVLKMTDADLERRFGRS